MTKRFVFTTGITGGNWYRQEQRERIAPLTAQVVTCTTALQPKAAISLNPSRSYQESLRAAAVPARGGYTAVSIDDYSRISSKRDEFLNFLLLPNPEGIPAIEYAGLRVA